MNFKFFVYFKSKFWVFTSWKYYSIKYEYILLDWRSNSFFYSLFSKLD